MWGSTTTRQRLRDSINCLRKLNEVPENPRENILVPTGSTQHLSMSREKEIVSNLAFLSATSDDSLKVMAVCVEEYMDKTGIVIRIASNTGDLSTVTAGLRTFARTLEQAAQRENSKAEDINTLFQQVVQLDLRRILSRLRSRHVKTRKTTGRPALITQLSQALDDESVRAASEFTVQSLRAAQDKSQNMQDLFARVEAISDISNRIAEIQELVRALIIQAHELNETINLDEALQTFSGDPNLKTHLPRAVNKLARYRSATSELICAARNRAWRLFRNVQVEPFRVSVPAGLGLTKYKVHAEIQLLFFYNLHPELPRPRIICSSKSACYLCNLFFRIHGDFQIPHTHGRLYDKWILPDWLDVPHERHHDLGVLATRLNEELEDKIQMTLKSKKSLCCHPIESTLLPSAYWPSSSALSRNLAPPDPTSTSLNRSLSTSITTGIPKAQTSKIESPPSEMDSIYIKENELPYHQLITLKTPSLHLQVADLSIAFEFIQVSSGQLSVSRADELILPESECSAINLEDIPTTKELELRCPQGSNSLVILLQSFKRKSLCLHFVWDRPL